MHSLCSKISAGMGTGFGGDIEMNDTTRKATDMPQDAPIKTK